MDRAFSTQLDWFEVKVKPAILRRTLIATALVFICVAGWLYIGSWIFMIIAGLVVFERAYEFIQIPSTKKSIASMKVVVTENGLIFTSANIKGQLTYPWSTLKYVPKRIKDEAVDYITVEDTMRKGSKIKLIGFESMEELSELIERLAIKS